MCCYVLSTTDFSGVANNENNVNFYVLSKTLFPPLIFIIDLLFMSYQLLNSYKHDAFKPGPGVF